MWIVLVAILVVALVGVSAFAVLGARTPQKYSIELWYNNDGHYGDTETAIALTLQNSIQTCGRVSVTLKSDPWTVFKTNRAPSVQKMPMFLLGWYPDYLDTDDYTSPFLSKSGAASTGSFYNNTQVDDWIREAGSTTDLAIRQDRYQKVQNQLAEDVPYIPLFTTGAQVVYNKTVQNVQLHPVSFKWFVVNKPGASTLNVSTSDKIISLDPADAYDYMSIEVINQVFDTLLVYDWKTSDLKPGLATEVPTVANGGISADGKTYTYHLRSGVMFHDGTTLNSTNVKNSIDRAIRLDLDGSAAFLLYDVGGLTANSKGKVNTASGVIETPDALTVKFHLFRPVSFFNALMAFSVSAPVPNSYSQTGKQPSTVGKVIGTGPYRLTTHVENSLAVLDKVTSYYNAQLYAADGIAPIPLMSKVQISIKESGAAVKQDIQTKAADVAYRTISPADLVDLQKKATTLGITVKLSSSPVIRYLVFNVNTISNKALRQAIAYSVDRSALNQIVFLNTAAPLYSMVPPGLPYNSPVFQSRYGDARCSDGNALLTTIPMSVELVAAARDR
jgi:peptide/nickel transport system substrate-binding protein